MERSNNDTNGEEASFEFVSSNDPLKSKQVGDAPPAVVETVNRPSSSNSAKDYSPKLSVSPLPPPSKLPDFSAELSGHFVAQPVANTSKFPTSQSLFSPSNVKDVSLPAVSLNESVIKPPQYGHTANLLQPSCHMQSTHTVASIQQGDMHFLPISTTSSQHQNPLSSTTVDLSDQFVTTRSTDEMRSDGDASGGIFSWLKDSVKGNEFLSKVAEKAKNSVDSVIYTLDPQMKDFMNSGGEVDIVIASDKEVKVMAIREAFQSTFGKAAVNGIASQANIASQPVGYTAALKGAEERIMNIRQRGAANSHQAVVAIENFLLETTPDNWFDIGCVMLQDQKRGLTLKTFTQATPVSLEYVTKAQDDTPSDYPLRWSGLSVPIGQIIACSKGVPHTNWHRAVCGVSRYEMLLLAGKSLAGQYKAHISSVCSKPATITL